MAEELRIALAKWRRRFAENRLQGLLNEQDHRCGCGTRHCDDRGAKTAPRSMTKAAGPNQMAIVRIWNAFGLQTYQQETFKISEDPEFIDKVRDVVGLYLCPTDNALVQYQAHFGAVNTGSTPSVQYAYEDGSANTIRLVHMTYPDGRELNYEYGASGSDNDLLSRVEELTEP